MNPRDLAEPQASAFDETGVKRELSGLAAHVVAFKREVYERALRYLAPLAGALQRADLDIEEATA